MVFDSLLCWPRTKAGEKVWQKCPDGVRGLDGESKYLINISQESTNLLCFSSGNACFFLLLLLISLYCSPFVLCFARNPKFIKKILLKKCVKKCGRNFQMVVEDFFHNFVLFFQSKVEPKYYHNTYLYK